MFGALIACFQIGFSSFRNFMKDKKTAKIVIWVIVGLMVVGGNIHSLMDMLLIFVLCILAIGIHGYIKLRPLRKQREDFRLLFERIRLISVKGTYPIFLGEDENEYLKLFAFNSIIPLKQWQDRQDVMEAYLNVKIDKICNDENDNNIIHLIIVKKSLPDNLFWNDCYISPSSDFLCIGSSYTNYVYIDLNTNAHAFIAGETGSGKSNILKCLIYQCILKNHEVKLIDFKRGVSFAAFDDTLEIYSDYDSIVRVLESLITETHRRLDLLRQNRAEDISQYNAVVPYGEKLKRVVVFIDELAELMRAGDKETSRNITNNLETLTRISRAAGINLMMGIQRPDSSVVGGQIKNNVSLRICGRFIDPEPSRIMLGNNAANNLPKIRGRFIFKDDEQLEFQAFRITDDVMLSLPEKSEKSYVIASEVQPAETESVVPVNTDSRPVLDFSFDDIDIK